MLQKTKHEHRGRRRCSTGSSNSGNLVRCPTSRVNANLVNLFQIELEKLNTATDDINKLEIELEVSLCKKNKNIFIKLILFAGCQYCLESATY